MTNYDEVIKSLLALSSAAQNLANSLQKIPIPEPAIEPQADKSEHLTYRDYEHWAHYLTPKQPKLEIAKTNPKSVLYLLGNTIDVTVCGVDSTHVMVAPNWNKQLPKWVAQLSGWSDYQIQGYDLIIINQYLEFDDLPSTTLAHAGQLLNPGGRLKVRLRPWTAYHGSFQENDGVNIAHIHLLSDLIISNQITQKVIQPLQTYETWFQRANLTIIEKLIHRRPLAEHTVQYLDLLVKRTWGPTYDKEQARKILHMAWVDYTVAP